MKRFITIATASLCLIGSLSAQELVTEYENFEKYSDFSVYGHSEARTLKIFKAEVEDEKSRIMGEHLKEGETLTITFTDIDMAGDIQPWRNTHNADIRYVEDIYPPRLKFRYVLTDAEGETLMEGEESISDLAYQMNALAPMRTRYSHFFYELELLRNWTRKTFRDR